MVHKRGKNILEFLRRHPKSILTWHKESLYWHLSVESIYLWYVFVNKQVVKFKCPTDRATNNRQYEWMSCYKHSWSGTNSIPIIKKGQSKFKRVNYDRNTIFNVNEKQIFYCTMKVIQVSQRWRHFISWHLTETLHLCRWSTAAELHIWRSLYIKIIFCIVWMIYN